MARTVYTGPLIIPGASPGTDSNPDSGPSLFDHGGALLDKRFWTGPGGADSEPIFAWGPGFSAIPVIDEVPSAAAAANIAALAHVVNGTPMVLVSSTGSGITVGVSIVNALTGAQVTGLLAIDSAGGGPIAAGVVTFGGNNAISLYDPTKAIARGVSVTGVSAGSGGHLLIKGFDVYGFPMSQNLTLAAGVNTVNTTKAFKYIQSVTPLFTDPNNVSVGTADVYGLPLLAGTYASLLVYFGNPATPANNLVTAATGFIAAVTTTASATTGDTRGTITATSDGTKRLTVLQTPFPANVGTSAGLTGVAQF